MGCCHFLYHAHAQISLWLQPQHFELLLSDVKVKVAQSCPILCDPMDYTVHGILQAHNTGAVSLSLLQGIFPTQGVNPGLPQCRWILYQLSHSWPLDCVDFTF